MKVVLHNRRGAALLLILLTAAMFRFVGLDQIPPGLSTDEAANGLDALDILSGHQAVFFERSNGREPLFIYLQAVSVALLGPTPLALRLPAALVGVATVFSVYLLAKRLFGQNTGMLAAAAVTASYWPLQLSREGFRAITLPLVATLIFYFLWRGLRERSRSSLAMSGVLLGLSQYTYSSARVLPVLVLAYLACLLLLDRRLAISNIGGLILMTALAVLTFAPLGAYFWAHPDAFTGRLVTASPTGSLAPTDLLLALRQNLAPTLGMFSFAGDAQWKYNLAGLPVFGPIWSLFFYSGMALAVWRWRQPAYPLLLLWLALGLAPGALSSESPHFLRTILVMPPAYILPAVALTALLAAARRRVPRRLLTTGMAVFLVGSTALTGWRYFGVWARAPEVSHVFYGDMAAAADFLNRHSGNERVVLSAEYYDLHHSMMHYLLTPEKQNVKWIDARRAFVYPAQANGNVLYVLPASAALTEDKVSRLLPTASLVWEARGADGLASVRVYRAIAPSAPAPTQPIDANLGNVAQLLGYDLEPASLTPGDTIRLNVYWRVLRTEPRDYTRTYSFFAHLVDDGDFLWAQDDGIGFLTPEWEIGDVVVSFNRIVVPADSPPRTYHLLLGMYGIGDPQPLSLLDARGAPTGTRLPLATLSLTRPGTIASGLPAPPCLDGTHWNGLTLRGFALNRATLGPGETLRVVLYWQATTPIADRHTLQLELADDNGSIWTQWRGDPVSGYPTNAWHPGETLRNWYDLSLPAEIPAGSYSVRLSLPASGSQSVRLGQVQVSGRAHYFVAPSPQHALSARFGDFAELLGYSTDRQIMRPGETLHLTLCWRAVATPPTAYTVFAHLLDEQSRLWGQQDSQPQSGAAPTTSWLPGEILTDTVVLPLPPDAPSGRYPIEIGMYQAQSGARLAITDDQNKPLGDHLILESILVEP